MLYNFSGTWPFEYDPFNVVYVPYNKPVFDTVACTADSRPTGGVYGVGVFSTPVG